MQPTHSAIQADDLVENGLVVGQLVRLSKSPKGKITISYYSGLSPMIDGVGENPADSPPVSKFADKKGYMAFAYPAGKFKIPYLYGSSTYTSGGYIYTNTTTIPLGLNFEVKAGDVSNLGYIILVTDQENQDRYTILVSNNEAHMLDYVSENYSDKLNQTPGTLTPVTEVKKLLARDEARKLLGEYFNLETIDEIRL